MQDEALFQVRVTPRASRDEVVGWRDNVLAIRLRAPPVEGQANEALRRFLAKRLDVPPSAISVVTGQTGRTKRLRVVGIGGEELRSRLKLED